MAKHEIEERGDGLIEKMVAVNRVTKVVKGGRNYEIGRASCRERV